MIAKETVDRIYSDPVFLQKTIERRSIKRAFYNNEDGIDVLADMIVSANVFGAIDPDDECAIGAHNFTIQFLEDIGLFDEDNLKEMIRFLLSLPVFPARDLIEQVPSPELPEGREGIKE